MLPCLEASSAGPLRNNWPGSGLPINNTLLSVDPRVTRPGHPCGASGHPEGAQGTMLFLFQCLQTWGLLPVPSQTRLLSRAGSPALDGQRAGQR